MNTRKNDIQSLTHYKSRKEGQNIIPKALTDEQLENCLSFPLSQIYGKKFMMAMESYYLYGKVLRIISQEIKRM